MVADRESHGDLPFQRAIWGCATAVKHAALRCPSRFPRGAEWGRNTGADGVGARLSAAKKVAGVLVCVAPVEAGKQRARESRLLAAQEV